MVKEAAVLAKRLTYSVGAIGLVLLGGYAVMLSQKWNPENTYKVVPQFMS